MIYLSLGLALIASISANLYLHFKKPKKTLTRDAQQLLAEIAGGQALLRIQVIDQGDIFIRSPGG